MKAAVYTGTRNLYQDMIPSIKSLLINSDVEKIYLLIEDDKFPFYLPSQCECINVSNQTFFPQNGANYHNYLTYMVLIRAALSKIFPQLDKILSLDVDTIIDKDISELWDINLNNYYYAGAKQPLKCTGGKFYFSPLYINCGVLLCNLKKLREDKQDDKIIQLLNTQKYKFAQQDVINKLCQQHLLEIPCIYNDTNWTGHDQNFKIMHYAAIKEWNNKRLVNKYRDIPFEKIRTYKHEV